jgi:hypothetical protein
MKNCTKKIDFSPNKDNENRLSGMSEQAVLIEEELNEQEMLLQVSNSFRLFNQALEVTHNFHKLAKKDSLSKVYTSIYNVICKESKRM